RMPHEEREKLKRGYPRENWHGGPVRMLRPSVLMLERGCIYEINGAYCFAFGGARSHDIGDGILDPADYPDERTFRTAYQRMRGGMFRVKGVSWWEAEMPSAEEMDRGRRNLAAFMEEHPRVDLVFTHDAPASDRLLLGSDETDELNSYLESLREIMRYGKWFYGHLHDNRRVSPDSYLLYEQIVRVR
ncbi:MAG: metallophosphatase, partial [Clostridia bacterium]|nr:metallophosphatase [Clostridia bacterium]